MTILLALVLAMATPASKPMQLKSLNCPDGDIYLSLKSDGTFSMFLDPRDPNGPRRVLGGTWKEKGAEVTLRHGEGEIVYARETTKMSIADRTFTLEGMRWVRGNHPTFADGFMLVDRTELERIVYRFAPRPPPEE